MSLHVAVRKLRFELTNFRHPERSAALASITWARALATRLRLPKALPHEKSIQCAWDGDLPYWPLIEPNQVQETVKRINRWVVSPLKSRAGFRRTVTERAGS
jgi:hypothetical protein